MASEAGASSTSFGALAAAERWAFIEAVPKTSVGKFDKKRLRASYAEGTLPVGTIA